MKSPFAYMPCPPISTNNTINVAHIITRLSLGGAQQNVLLTSRGLKQNNNFSTTIIAGRPTGKEGGMVKAAKKLSNRLLLTQHLVREVNPYHDLKALLWLVGILKNNDYDIVHTHSSKAGIIGRAAAFLTNVPLCYHTIHGLGFHKYQPAYKKYFYKWLEGMAAKITDRIQAVCPTMVKEAKKAGLKPNNGYTVVPSGMKLSPYLNIKKDHKKYYRRQFEYKNSDYIYCKIARLAPLKGHHDALEAFSKVAKKEKNVKLLFVGGGELRNELINKTIEYGIRNDVVFTGMVAPGEVPAYIGASDAVMHTSYREGLPRIIPQSFAAKRPVVAYAIDGIPDLLTPKTGYPVQAGKIKQLAKAMISVKNKNNQHKIKRARQTILPYYRWRYMVNSVINDYAYLYNKQSI